MSSALDRRSQTRVVISLIVQALVAVTVLLVLYYVVPTPGSRVGPVACAIVFLGVVSLELRAVVRDPLPVPRAAVAMGRLRPLFIVLFAWSYVAMSRSDPSAFSEPLTRSAALYFTITVLSTVGFGDITPVADAHGLRADDLRPRGDRDHREAHHGGGQARSCPEDGCRERGA